MDLLTQQVERRDRGSTPTEEISSGSTGPLPARSRLPNRQQEWRDRSRDRQPWPGDQRKHGSIARVLRSPARRRLPRRPCGAGGMGQSVRGPAAAVERPTQRRTGGRGRRAHPGPGARRRLRRGRGRRLARPRRLGRDALWRSRAWRCERAAGHARDAGVAVRWVHAELAQADAAAGVLRPRLRAVPGPAAHAGRGGRARTARGGRTRRRAAARAPRGDGNPAAQDNAFDPADYVWPSMVAALLDDDWAVELDEQRPRIVPDGGAGAHHVDDIVLRARRLR